jgi:hypothetical protein
LKLLNYDRIKSAIVANRKKKFPKARTVKEFQLEMRKKDSKMNFAAFRQKSTYVGTVSSVQGGKASIFLVPQMIDKLNKTGPIALDGTFRTAPRLFKQVVNIFGEVNEQVIF